jgi:geranylgeranyl diphosphate synthase type I
MNKVDLPWIDEYVDKINKKLKDLFPHNLKLYEIVNEILLSGGKRIRGVLTMLGCEAVGGNKEFAVPAALIYELGHVSSLIQDDIMDGNLWRRGTKTIHFKYGIDYAILASDIPIFETYKLISHYVGKIPNDRFKRLLELGTKSSMGTTLGQFQDLEMAKGNGVSKEAYFEMIKNKTGVLLGAPLQGGALLGGGTKEQVQALYNFGEKLGMAYQIRDDLLDIFGEEKEIKKEIFVDVKMGLKSLPILLTLSKAKEDEAKIISGILGNKDIDRTKIEQLRGIMRRYNVEEHARKIANNLIKEAIEELDRLPDNGAKQKLKEISKFAVRRYS